MNLLLSNNQLTKFSRTGEYATTTNIPLEGEVSAVAAGLLAWLAAQLAEGETLSQVMLEAGGQVATAFETQTDEEGNEIQVATAYRPTISAAVSVTAPLGSRTFVVSSESLPTELRDGLLAAWQSLSQPSEPSAPSANFA
jgi:hypothetical protein